MIEKGNALVHEESMTVHEVLMVDDEYILLGQVLLKEGADIENATEDDFETSLEFLTLLPKDEALEDLGYVKGEEEC